MQAHKLQNSHWQAGIIAETGASIVYGRIRYSGNWLDLLRPTDPADMGNSSTCSSFIMLPWANRIRDGQLNTGDETYTLRTSRDDNTARHGDVRNRPWQTLDASETYIRLRFESREHANVNWPFAFSAEATYALEGNNFFWTLSMTNEDTRSFPAGFGHHPYFVRTGAMPLLEIPAEREFPLEQAMATGAPVPVSDVADFRSLRSLEPGVQLDHLLTARDVTQPVRIVYPLWHTALHMEADPIFRHILVFTDTKTPSVAVEPQTNANDGFNLHQRGITAAGVFDLQPGARMSGTVRLSVYPYEVS